MGRFRVWLVWAAILLSAKVLGTRSVGDTANDTTTEEEVFEDPLTRWLENFDTYTFMVEQEVQDKDNASEGSETGSITEEPFTSVEDLELEDDYDQTTLAPVTISLKKMGRSLLNPNIDYEVKIESLIAEEGSILVILESFENKTLCGVGGFSLHLYEEKEANLTGTVQPQQEPDRETTDEDSPRLTTTKAPIVAFAVDTEDESPTTWTVGDDAESEWEDHSKDLWWAMGRLAGGGLLTLVFTPPECGCFVMKAYYALAVGDNVTLVVGPESYPSDLDKFFCVDPSISSIEENLIESEEEDEDMDLEEVDDHSVSHGRRGGHIGASRKKPEERGRVNSRRRMKLQKKKLRQEARQAIRQAGRRVTKKRIRAHLRLRRREGKTEAEKEARKVGRTGGKWARKQARRARKQQKRERKVWKGGKPWRKHKKHARRNRNKHNRANRRRNRNQNVTDIEEEDYHDHVNATTEPPTEEDTIADLLLGDEGEEEEEEEAETIDSEGSEDVPISRRERKRQRQERRKAKKIKNKEKKKGSKFCCKQGIKYKKAKLMSVNATEEEEIPCDNIDDVIITFALRQFNIDDAHCSSRYETCCAKFTTEFWENLKLKKAARKEKRKQQRKAVRQQRRRQNRRQRMSTSTTPAV